MEKLKHLLLAGLLVCAWSVCALRIEPGTPVFAKPDPRGQPLATVQTAFEAKARSQTVFFLPHDFMVRRMVFHEIAVGGGKYAYVSPEVRCGPDAKGVWRTELLPPAGIKFGDRLLWCVLAIATVVLAWRARLRLKKNGGEGADWILAWLPGLGRSLVLLSCLMICGGIYLFSSDEPDFFVTGADLAAGSLAHFQPRSLGTGVWYAPFVAFFHAKDVLDILVPVSYATAFVLSPFALALFYSFLRRFLTRGTALTALTVFAVLPLFFFRLDVFSKGIAQCFFYFPDAVPGYRLYQTMTWGGFNAMSDTPAMLCLFAALAAAVRFVRPRTAMMWSAGLLAAAMLFRVNAALFFPAFAYLWWRLRPKAADWAWAAAAGFVVFLPQLIVNTLQLGNPLIFPYVRYEHTADGFMFGMFPANARLMFGANAPFFSAGLAGLLLMKNTDLRRFFVLWIVPTTVFFLGYYHYQDDATRFLLPLFAPLAAAAAAGFRDAFGLDRVKILLVSAMILFTAPGIPLGIAAAECWHLPPGTTGIVTGACLLVAVWDAWRTRDWRLVPWIAVYPWGGVWLPSLLLIASAITSFPWRKIRKSPPDASTTVEA